MCPAIASGVVTEDALVSYWPMLLAIITICTRAQLHSKTISGVCLRSKRFRAVSEQRVKDRAIYILSWDNQKATKNSFQATTFKVEENSSSFQGLAQKFKDFSRKKGIQGLFKTVRTLF